MPEEAIIRCRGLRKNYGPEEVLRGMTFDVPRGSVFGLLGRNGAGKSTLMKILLGMVHASSGSAEVFGLPATDPVASVAIRKRVAFVSEGKDLCDYMTVDELLDFAAALYPSWRGDLQSHYSMCFEVPRDRRIKSLSQGTRTKVALLVAFASGSELLVLDEPTSGLDPAAAEQVLKAVIAHVSREGATVFLSSHSISEIDQIADHVAIVDSGRTVVNGALDDVREGYHRVRLVFERAVPRQATQVFGPERVRCDGRTLTLLVRGDVDTVLLEANALEPLSVDVVPVTLQEIFLESVAES